jgi:Acetyltransferase (GNAT) domain
MDDATLLGRVWTGIRSLQEWVERGSAEGRRVPLSGGVASVCPATPDRSLLNSVVYEDATELPAVLAAAERLYDDAGVRAWTVWVPADDDEARAVLDDHGHVLDARPQAMGLELSGLPGEVSDEPAWEGDWAAWPDAARVNDRAYGDAEGTTSAALGALPAGTGHLYLTRAGDAPAAFVLVHDIAGDVVFALAATVPEARGRGLVTGLLHRALLDGRERGAETSTTIATAMGEPVYARLGYRGLGRIEMWERRRAP